MAYTTRIAWETLRTLDSSTLTGGYDVFGTPTTHQAYKIKMVNLSNKTVTVSVDGTTDIDVCPTLGFWLYDETVTQNHEGLPTNTQFYVKGTAGTGNIYLVVQYLAIV
jgi:hypothetical protein